MFTHRKGRFYLGSTSFALPNECLIDTKTPIVSHNSIIIKPLDQPFQIYISFYPSGKDAFGSIRELVCDWLKATGVKQEYYSCGTGWSTFYGNKKSSFYEVWFDMKTPVLDEMGHLLRTLTVEVRTDTMDGVKTAIKCALFQELLESIEL